MMLRALVAALLFSAVCRSQTAVDVLVVVNQRDITSRHIGEYYVQKRHVPLDNVCRIDTPPVEEISWETYLREVEKPVGLCLTSKGLQEKITYLVTTRGVPLKVAGRFDKLDSECAAVDSELTLLYPKLKGRIFGRAGIVPNPYFGKRDVPFRREVFPMYLVTRLAAYDFDETKAMIDRSIAAHNDGKFVIDLKSSGDEPGDNWLRDAALLLPKERVVFDDSSKVLYGEKNVIGYASWGSNDKNRKERFQRFQWQAGALATEFVSTDARSLERPPVNWTITSWTDRLHWFAGSPQSMTADFIHEGATAATGHVYEPFLGLTPRPDLLLPAYYRGRNLAESFYLSIQGLSWMNIVLGDPLCTLGKPQ